MTIVITDRLDRLRLKFVALINSSRSAIILPSRHAQAA
jgi:hypothetical protein